MILVHTHLKAQVTTSAHQKELSHPIIIPLNCSPKPHLKSSTSPPPQPDYLAVWHQLSLRQNCINNWVRETFDLNVQADHPQDTDTITLTLPDGDSTDKINLDSCENFTDSDELSSLEDQSDNSSYATEQLFSSSDDDSDDKSELNQPYTTTL
ncbi:hypothetical protein PCANC_25712 [Puccinia coronata f. sp. avenae]|uniref:Uncharacterized protein n=1 Tax=Puccinia coronata f. sp. avenae TaxID=200324 RepID=A0A2N5S4W4_9BASI|nr:hypothetical protein PCANC_25712 [Puccinia coronata f. sp. avenae]